MEEDEEEKEEEEAAADKECRPNEEIWKGKRRSWRHSSARWLHCRPSWVFFHTNIGKWFSLLRKVVLRFLGDATVIIHKQTK